MFFLHAVCLVISPGLPFESGSSQTFFLMASRGVFPCHCCLWLPHLHLDFIFESLFVIKNKTHTSEKHRLIDNPDSQYISVLNRFGAGDRWNRLELGYKHIIFGNGACGFRHCKRIVDPLAVLLLRWPGFIHEIPGWDLMRQRTKISY